MTELFHLNCVRIVSPYNENVCGHCLLIREHERLVLIDTGIGIQDIRHPQERMGKELIDMVGYRFDENQTAVRQIERLGFHPNEVSNCIISHLDNDHTGGLADFPNAIVHVGQEEYDNYASGNPRYLKTPLSIILSLKHIEHPKPNGSVLKREKYPLLSIQRYFSSLCSAIPWATVVLH